MFHTCFGSILGSILRLLSFHLALSPERTTQLRIVGNLKVSKAKWVETFTFLLNVDPSSAPPTRRIAKLSGWCAERAKRFGGRLPDAKEINDSMKLQASHHSSSVLHDKSDLKALVDQLDIKSKHFIALHFQMECRSLLNSVYISHECERIQAVHSSILSFLFALSEYPGIVTHVFPIV